MLVLEGPPALITATEPLHVPITPTGEFDLRAGVKHLEGMLTEVFEPGFPRKSAEFLIFDPRRKTRVIGEYEIHSIAAHHNPIRNGQLLRLIRNLNSGREEGSIVVPFPDSSLRPRTFHASSREPSFPENSIGAFFATRALIVDFRAGIKQQTIIPKSFLQMI